MRNVRCQFRQQQQEDELEEGEDEGLDEMRRLAKLISLIASIKLIKLTPNGSSTRRARDTREIERREGSVLKPSTMSASSSKCA